MLANCKEYSWAGEDIGSCKNCNDGYLLNSGKCDISCTSPCYTCSESEDTCYSCITDFSLTLSNKCIEESSLIANCKIMETISACNECLPGFVVASTQDECK